MLITDFDYELPEELIAQKPLERREGSRMLVVERAGDSLRDEHFVDFPHFLRETDVVVLNNTRVFPARLLGEKMDGGAGIELFLVREIENRIWETLARPARRLKQGTRVLFGGAGKLVAEVLEKTVEGRCLVRFETDENFDEVLEEIGKTPLPPYIKRETGGGESPERDRERYQTVFARQKGAIAAPTAGLHFTPEILERIKARGARLAEITLHVGYGTFEPVRVSDLSEHRVAPEQCEISEETAEILNLAKERRHRIIAVGTTTTRTLESAISEQGKFAAGKRTANLTITPGYKFKAIDGLLTNFHLPQSSLLVLVSTFAGFDRTMRAYEHAVQSRYRFYSYGDCMLII